MKWWKWQMEKGWRPVVLLGCFIAFVAGAVGLLLSQPVQAQDDHAQSSAERLVTIRDRGREQTIMTRARTARQALQLARVTVDETRDAVEPNIDLELTGTTFTVTIFRARPVTIIDESRRSHITTAEQTPQRIAKAAGITLYVEDKVEFMTSDNMLLDGANVLMNITRAPLRTVTEEVDIDFPVEQIKDANQPIGFKEIKQLGEKGIRTVTYQAQAERGVEISRKEISSRISKQPKKQIEVIGTKPKNPLTKSKGAHIFTDSHGVAHRETYYDLPMNVVINACGGGGYTVRADGAKVDKDGYILVAANYGNYPRCSVVETSMGPGKVYDTGGFAARHPHGFDLATDWTNGDGR